MAKNVFLVRGASYSGRSVGPNSESNIQIWLGMYGFASPAATNTPPGSDVFTWRGTWMGETSVRDDWPDELTIEPVANAATAANVVQTAAEDMARVLVDASAPSPAPSPSPAPEPPGDTPGIGPPLPETVNPPYQTITPTSPKAEPSVLGGAMLVGAAAVLLLVMVRGGRTAQRA